MKNITLQKEIIDAYKEGLSISLCSGFYEVPQTTIHRKLKKLNILRSQKNSLTELVKKYRKPTNLNCNGEIGREIEHWNEWQRNYALGNKLEWKQFFINHYGETVKCQVCGQNLKFMNGCKKNGSVHFDHRKDNLKINQSPGRWIRGHKCNDKNQKIFMDCNFGILCGSCNGNLPTKNRKGWLLKALEYSKDN